MKRQLTTIALTLGLIAWTPVVYGSNQDQTPQGQRVEAQSDAVKTSREAGKPEHNMPPGKMGAATMGSGLPGNGPTPHSHVSHKKHKKGHKMQDGKVSPDKMPEARP